MITVTDNSPQQINAALINLSKNVGTAKGGGTSTTIINSISSIDTSGISGEIADLRTTLEGLDFLDADDLAASLNNYVSTADLVCCGYITSSDLSCCGYITSTDLSCCGYATSTGVATTIDCCLTNYISCCCLAACCYATQSCVSDVKSTATSASSTASSALSCAQTVAANLPVICNDICTSPQSWEAISLYGKSGIRIRAYQNSSDITFSTLVILAPTSYNVRATIIIGGDDEPYWMESRSIPANSSASFSNVGSFGAYASIRVYYSCY